jgi:hypothetical protein
MDAQEAIVNRILGLALFAVLALAVAALAIGCESGKGSASADNSYADDDSSPVDDDSASDDDASPTGQCVQIAQDVVQTCQITLKDIQGDQVGQAGMADWCTLSEEFFRDAKASPFWSCMDNCAVAQSCDQTCFSGCLTPPDPSGTGCGHTVYQIYSCGVVFVYNNTNYWVPEMDEIAVCSTDTSTNWLCYATCATNNPCSNPPTPAQAQALINCMNAC